MSNSNHQNDSSTDNDDIGTEDQHDHDDPLADRLDHHREERADSTTPHARRGVEANRVAEPAGRMGGDNGE
jgi:hypothetical protein